MASELTAAADATKRFVLGEPATRRYARLCHGCCWSARAASHGFA